MEAIGSQLYIREGAGTVWGKPTEKSKCYWLAAEEG